MEKSKKEKILESALKLFEKQGYNSTGTRQIAKEAGVSDGLIFSHFKNKVGLVSAITTDAEKKGAKLLSPIFEETNPIQVIKTTIETVFQFKEKDYGYWKLMIRLKWEIDYNNPEKFAPLMKKLTQSFTELEYENPEMEAQLLLQITESMLAEIIKGNTKQQEKLKEFLLKKYNI